jgi:hypothetical protein
MSKRLFKTSELTEMGFEQAHDGGFIYLTKGNLVTGDVEYTGEDFKEDDVHRVYELPDLSTQLTEKQILEILKDGEKTVY